LTKVYLLIDAKTILAADIAEAHITGQETPANDPHKKADAENRGWMSGDQFTISETPVAPLGATIGTK
jgi:hypothetical protein